MTFSATSWTDITPPGLGLMPHTFPSYGVIWVAVAPSDNNIVFCCVDYIGLYKSTDAGVTWVQMGISPGTPYGPTTTFIDSPFSLLIDPADPNHLYCTSGVRGNASGFWISTDGGSNWTMPSGFASICDTVGNYRDVTTIDVEPGNFSHIIISSHAGWSNIGSGTNAGILESTDSGSTWTAHNPQSTWPSETFGIHFLYDPATSQGNGTTWLVGTGGNGMWRTTNSGTSWTQVSTISISQGGQSHYYASDGRLYIGAEGYPLVSSDNGATWSQLTNLQIHYYYCVVGDGVKLYTSLSFTGDNGFGGSQPFYTSLESDGINWASFQGGVQTYTDGPYNMIYAKTSGIMYAALWGAGLVALKARDVSVFLSVPGMHVSVF